MVNDGNMGAGGAQTKRRAKSSDMRVPPVCFRILSPLVPFCGRIQLLLSVLARPSFASGLIRAIRVCSRFAGKNPPQSDQNPSESE